MNGPKKVTEDPSAGVFDACKLQFKAGLAVVDTLVAGSERMREMQLAAARETETRNREIAGEIGKARSMQDLVELQTRLINAHAQSVMGYWTKMAALTQQTQSELNKLVQDECSGALAAMPATGGKSAAGAAPLASVFESSLEATRRANEAFIAAWSKAIPAGDRRGASAGHS